ncbi:MAG: hypothetical protein JJ959_19770 [Nisaea sp.]|uniref:DsrE family protein n=1 Tax=Nisaea sp. TaxID=2024842 RepID=UPI001B10570D|nr:hypothetical protein [Nisaea sp.]MBO6562797.1 hypothetical protein [Nisaea sp.]
MPVLFRALVLICLVTIGSALPAVSQAEDGVHRLVLQISDNDPHKMMGVLNVAANVSRHYSGIGEEVEIRIVAFEGGLHLLRTDTAPEDVAKRVQGFGMSMPNVTFLACGNTIDTMERLEGKKIPILEDAEIVQTGVVALIEANEAGWTIVRP